jgi:hypothetical protein
MREGVFIVNNSRTWGRDCPHAIRKGGYIVHFRVNVWASMFEDIVVSPCLVRDSLIAQNIVILCKQFCRDCLKAETDLWLQRYGNPAH